MPKQAITSSGDFREFLSGIMIGIKNGHIKPEEASSIVRVAQQVNESFYSEIKMKQVSQALGERVYALGALPVGGADSVA